MSQHTLSRHSGFLRAGTRALLVFALALCLPAPAHADYRSPAKLKLSTRIPSVGETLVVTVKVRTTRVYEGDPVVLYQGFRPGCDGFLERPVPIDRGVIQGGICTFSYLVPSGTQPGLEFYLAAIVRTPQGPFFSEVQGLTTIPAAKDADWEVETDGYTKLSTGVKTLTGAKSAIVGAFNASSGGDVILVRAGNYTDKGPMKFSNPSTGGLQRRFIIAEDAGSPSHSVVLKRLPFGGSATVQLMDLSDVTFVGLKIEAYQWGILWGTPTKPTSGIHFLETEIDGGWDFLTSTGTCSKWAVQGKNSSDMLFRGGYIHDICQEHAFYIQNQTGDLAIENVLADRIGRTFLQTTSRVNEGPPGLGQITVRNVLIRDVALEGNCQTAALFRGGSALTFTGRHMGPGLVDNAIVQFGFNKGLNQVAGFNIGTAAFVTWLGNGSGSIPNGPIRVQNSRFQLAPGSGDRANVQVNGGTSEFTFQNMLVDRPGGGFGRNALEITQDASTLHMDAQLTSRSVQGAVKYYGLFFSTYPEFINSGLLPSVATAPGGQPASESGTGGLGLLPGG